MVRNDETAREYLERLLTEIGVEVDPEGLTTVERHLSMVLEVNRSLNLTAITEPLEAVRLHCVDSLSTLPFIREAAYRDVCDIGSGAGFPGIPIAAATEYRVSLVESVGKKARFLEEAVASLGLADRVRVHRARAEEHALVARESYDLVTARAVTRLGGLLELSSPLLRSGGVLAAMKSRPGDEELEDSQRVAGITGMEEVGVHEFELPDGGEIRTMFLFRKVRGSSIDLPRRTGMAQRNPL